MGSCMFGGVMFGEYANVISGGLVTVEIAGAYEPVVSVDGAYELSVAIDGAYEPSVSVDGSLE